MFDIRIEGLEELERKLKRLPDEIRKETERELREAANRIVLSAQMKCPDANIRERITSQVTSSGERISVTISAPAEARPYLEQAFEENRERIPKEVADAVKRALEKR